MTRKAYNVQQRGGMIMLLISDDKTFKDYKNVDDKIGDRITIPTIILRKEEGSEIKRFIEKNKKERVAMSIKFFGKLSDDSMTFDLFLRSDDPKALHFFTEFKQYYDLLKNEWTFTPYYKYYQYTWEQSSDVPNAKGSEPCMHQGKYCAHENEDLQIYNPRIVLIENIRQSCIFKIYKDDANDVYWNYMINFSDTCVDINYPIFTEECAEDIMELMKIDKDEVDKCIKTNVQESDKSIAAKDYQNYINKKVHKIPEVQINGIKYRGNWHADNIFEAICAGFITDTDICKTPDPSVIMSDDSGLGFGSILLIIICIILALIVVIICYRRIVNLALEATLNEKIQSQAIHSIGQYEVFKDETTGRKTIDVSTI